MVSNEGPWIEWREGKNQHDPLAPLAISLRVNSPIAAIEACTSTIASRPTYFRTMSRWMRRNAGENYRGDTLPSWPSLLKKRAVLSQYVTSKAKNTPTWLRRPLVLKTLGQETQIF